MPIFSVCLIFFLIYFSEVLSVSNTNLFIWMVIVRAGHCSVSRMDGLSVPSSSSGPGPGAEQKGCSTRCLWDEWRRRPSRPEKLGQRTAQSCPCGDVSGTNACTCTRFQMVLWATLCLFPIVSELRRGEGPPPGPCGWPVPLELAQGPAPRNRDVRGSHCFPDALAVKTAVLITVSLPEVRA